MNTYLIDLSTILTHYSINGCSRYILCNYITYTASFSPSLVFISFQDFPYTLIVCFLFFIYRHVVFCYEKIVFILFWFIDSFLKYDHSVSDGTGWQHSLYRQLGEIVSAQTRNENYRGFKIFDFCWSRRVQHLEMIMYVSWTLK